MRRSDPVRQVAAVVLLAGSAMLAGGCNPISRFDLGTDLRGSQYGRVYYVGGAGTFGNVGMLDIPQGLRRAGYLGSFEVFQWQSIVGGTLRDQVDRSRNEEQGRRLAEEIVAYKRQYPGRPVYVIALSAGTAVTTWALEKLTGPACVENVVFFGSSMSCTYDLSAALRRVNGALYNFFSSDDAILRFALPITGSVDRERGLGDSGVAGLQGFGLPDQADETNRTLFHTRVRNMPYREQYRRYGYAGNHTDATSANFIQCVVAPLVIRRAHFATTVPPSPGG